MKFSYSKVTEPVFVRNEAGLLTESGVWVFTKNKTPIFSITLVWDSPGPEWLIVAKTWNFGPLVLRWQRWRQVTD